MVLVFHWLTRLARPGPYIRQPAARIGAPGVRPRLKTSVPAHPAQGYKIALNSEPRLSIGAPKLDKLIAQPRRRRPWRGISAPDRRQTIQPTAMVG